MLEGLQCHRGNNEAIGAGMVVIRMELRSALLSATLCAAMTGAFADQASAGVPICYARSYDASHLAKNPHQTVTSIEMALKEESGEYQIWLTRRGSKTLFYNAGRCDSGYVKGKPGLYCHALMDCDGDCGSFGVVFETDKSLLAHFRVALNSFPLLSDEGRAELVPELDDGVFRLHRQPVSACAFNPEYEHRIQPIDSDDTPLPPDQGFISPTGNIHCIAIESDSGNRTLSCELKMIANLPSRRPSWCDYDWGKSFELDGAGTGKRTCQSDSSYLEGLQVLPYGSDWKFPGFRCLSERAGVTCTNTNGHGFRLSRDSQDIF